MAILLREQSFPFTIGSTMPKNYGLRIAVYADGAHLEEIRQTYVEGQISGFTTNPSLIARAGVKDYTQFARSFLALVPDLPISFEVFADEFDQMQQQAQIIRSWGNNVYVKIPIINSRGQSAVPLIEALLAEQYKLNVTAIFTLKQLNAVRRVMKPADDAIISVFAGRIADTGIDPLPIMEQAVALFADLPRVQILWASPREALNIYQAQSLGCHIITLTGELIQKLWLRDKSLEEFSIDTVRGFYHDAQQAGFHL